MKSGESASELMKIGGQMPARFATLFITSRLTKSVREDFMIQK